MVRSLTTHHVIVPQDIFTFFSFHSPFLPRHFIYSHCSLPSGYIQPWLFSKSQTTLSRAKLCTSYKSSQFYQNKTYHLSPFKPSSLVHISITKIYNHCLAWNHKIALTALPHFATSSSPLLLAFNRGRAWLTTGHLLEWLVLMMSPRLFLDCGPKPFPIQGQCVFLKRRSGNQMIFWSLTLLISIIFHYYGAVFHASLLYLIS